MERLEKLRNCLEIAICSCFIASIFFYGSQYAYLHTQFDFCTNDPIWFFMVQAFSGILAVIVPYQLRKKGKLFLSPLLYSLYLLFLFASLFLGELCHFYLLISGWDSLLHFTSGILLFFVFFEWIRGLQIKESSSIPFSLILAVCCSLAVGSIWEIYEFISDGVFHTNMQRFLDIQGNAFFGRYALLDTMSDLIFGFLGSILGGVYYIYTQKYKDKSKNST